MKVVSLPSVPAGLDNERAEPGSEEQNRSKHQTGKRNVMIS